MNIDKLSRHPRLVALAMVAAGLLGGALIIGLGGMEAGGRAGNKLMLLVGVAGIAFGAGLVQLIWPAPPKSGPDDDRHFFARARWPQKIYFVFGGLIGIVAAAILMTWASGKI